MLTIRVELYTSLGILSGHGVTHLYFINGISMQCHLSNIEIIIIKMFCKSGQCITILMTQFELEH